MAGRPRKPDHLKIVEGDREDRINRDAPIPALTSIDPPMKLSERATGIWNQLAGDMKDKGILSDWDLPALAMACDQLAMYWEYRDLLESHKESDYGPYLELGAAGGIIKHPYHQMMRDMDAMFKQWASRFGMTPADRSKLSVRDGEGKVSGLDELIS